MSSFCFIKVLPFSWDVNAFGAGGKKFGAVHKISETARKILVEKFSNLTQKSVPRRLPEHAVCVLQNAVKGGRFSFPARPHHAAGR
jgi:hypothetical protein